MFNTPNIFRLFFIAYYKKYLLILCNVNFFDILHILMEVFML